MKIKWLPIGNTDKEKLALLIYTTIFLERINKLVKGRNTGNKEVLCSWNAAAVEGV